MAYRWRRDERLSMDWLNLLVLALVQGITEFLPISSSAHLILVPRLFGWQDQGLAIDVATHFGTLLAVMVYFRAEVGRLVTGGVNLLTGRADGDTRLLLQIIVATIPVVILGFALKGLVATEFRSPLLIAATTIGFGVLLFVADRRGDAAERGLGGMTYRDALLIGLFQALALIPGVSRSGITMTAALFLAFSRTEAARFSLLLSIPTIIAAALLGGIELWQSDNAALQADAVYVAALAFAAAYVAIWAMMAWLRRFSFTPFVLYRFVLGAFLLYWFA
jgi:undecaprenyl-diphosphatase